jgi:hypothetical protein
MEIETAIQQYLIDLKETAPREQVKFDLTILARLEEYLEGDGALASAQAIRSADLRGFIRDWYRDGEDVTPETAARLVAAVLGWAQWLDRRFPSAPGPVSAAEASLPPSLAPTLLPLEESLPRAARAADLLRRYTRREDLSQAIPVAEAEGGSPLGTISGGVARVVRPAEVDYDRAEEDTYVVSGVEERSLALISPAREQLGEGPAAPVVVPPQVARLLRAGDILHVEIAPAGAGWEILNVETIYPGGLDDRP